MIVEKKRNGGTVHEEMVTYTRCMYYGHYCLGCSMEPPEWAKDSSDKGRNKTIKVGFSVSTLNNPFFVTLKKGAEKESER